MDGIILVNKPNGCTSHDVVNKIKHVFNEKVGHTGTLDPNATGLLPILIGKGTKLSYYLINHDKEYEVVLKLGEKTDTADSEGQVIEKREVKDTMLDENNVIDSLKHFIGKQEQVPPMYSAIKIKGKKLYEYARKNIKVEVEPRQIEIYSIELSDINKTEQTISFKVKCSKGTYIRSLCEDIAEKLGTVGYMKELNRTQVGIFNITDSISLDELEDNKNNNDFLQKHLITIEKLFIKLYKENEIQLNDKKLQLFLNGVKFSLNNPEGLYRIYDENNKFIGIGCIESGRLSRKIV